MKHKLIWSAVVCTLCSAITFTTAAFAEDASQFTMSTSDTESTGEFTVTLKGEQLADLFAYEAKFSIDASKLEVVKAETKIEGFSISPIVKDNEVTIAHTKIGKVDGEKGDVILGTITFKAKKVGTTNVKWTSLKTVDHTLKNQIFTMNASQDFTKIFSDLAGHWAKPDIMEMVGKQIVEGMDDDHFAPDTNVTRAQFATLIAKVMNLKDSAGQTPFDDVASGSWYESTVKKAYAAGLIDGISEHEFAPEKNITREEMTAMLIRAKAQAAGIKVQDMPANGEIPFQDEAEVSEWAKPFVQLAVEEGLMNGRSDQAFAPQEHASRAEAVVVLKRLLKDVGQ
ncbi:S-layer homology domain-containing protein [Paenibacillus sp. MAH-36]|uniref:S-layer homology domain-containing protein n=1 Tax=Paenibacillus violae TaxID=3077234 RepID=A0ABU3R5X0_9BACL|nr:S-layer homology domain-containing protein [Paenibacillus sp. PFR10]MDU0199665.1 S-layer homology domain-containing protein [Paenibacillus sp. PFR10]